MVSSTEKKTHFLYDKNLWMSLLVTVILYVICFAFFEIRFETNDDLIMSLIAKGYYTGVPDYHLFYINSVTGRFLAGLYSINGDIHWYSILLLFLQFIAIWGVFYGLLIKNVYRNLLVLCLCFPFAYFIINLQFTSITILLAFAGILLFEVLQPQTKLELLIPFLLLFLSSVIRFEAFVFAMIIGAVFLLRRIVKEKLYTAFLLFILVTAIPQIIDKIDYRSEDWQYFNNYVALLAKTGDNPSAFWNRGLIVSSLNIPEQNINLLYRYILVQDFDVPTLSNIYALTSDSRNLWRPYINELRNFLRYYIILEICLFLLLIFSFLYNKQLIIPLLLPNILLAVVLFNRLPKDRIIFGGMLIAITLSLINLRNLRREFIYSVLLLVAISFSIQIFKLNSDSPIDTSSLKQNDSYVVINPGNVFGGREDSPFDLNYLNGYNVVVGGWLTNSPLMTEQLKRYGISSAEPHISLLDNDEINEKTLYLDRNNSRAKEVFNEIQKYLNSKGKILSIESQNDSLIIYRISKQAN